ncbi:hypothetical protein BHUM_04286 [Candidatus Burkholderia humilis]|nr:hypothetical protein BHUM_04286 [Candidatus Burkholderia humilis]
MKRTGFAVIVAIAANVATPVFARDDGPRFVQDRLDALVAQHAQANRHIAQSGQDVRHAAASKDQCKSAAS